MFKATPHTHGRLTAAPLILIGAIIALAGGGYYLFSLTAKGDSLEQQLHEAQATEDALQTRIAMLESSLASTTAERDEFEEKFEAEKEKVDDIEDQIRDITGTVGRLDKLSKTDEELLQKYSKVYFLNEHYQPEDLDKIDDEYTYNESREEYLHGDVMPFFEDMMEDAADDDIDLWVISAFRSFETQSQLKGQYTVTYGSGANTFSADQGYSEHQLGTTIDFTTTGLNGGLTGFQNTPAYEWLTDNAHKYGFTLSYPPNNTFYIFEPWHWRFVGTDLAEDLEDDGEYFYDLDQRRIDEYLISIFD